MHKKFDHQAIEKKWQDKWQTDKLYDVGERETNKEKKYILVELPYPSGNLHIGHWYAFAVPDIYVRHQRMIGKQVMFPMGFDAFGLPAENAAIKRDINPREWTESNIKHMRDQLASMGASFSWDKTASTIDPNYYKWTQWMFTKFFEKGLAYRGEAVVNWDPVDNTVIANEQVLPDGTSERSGALVEKKVMPQWMLRITNYADRLLDDLDELDWPEHIKEAQRQWIGRSRGAEIDFKLSTGDKLTVFTTRPDTLFGATYMVMAPEHPLVEKNKDVIKNWSEVETYVGATKKKSEQDRLNDSKEKTGVKLEGVTAINPGSGEEIPVFIADYVLASYGTGAIMAVPAHDERDNEFAKKYKIEIKTVIGHVSHTISKTIEKHRTGVYGLIENEKGEYLLQYFRKPDYYWLPGGGMDANETEIEALKREIIEETGYSDFIISDRIHDFFYEYDERNGDGGGCNRTIIYKIIIDSNTKRQNVTLTDAELGDGLETLWISREDLENKLQDGDRSRAKLIFEAINWNSDTPYTLPGRLINSDKFDLMDSEEAKEAITKHVNGRMTNTYRLRDWSIGRQRYWGVPIPIVYDPEGKAHVVPEEHLPWLLPEDVKDYKPTGEPPLAKSQELKERTEKIFGQGWTPECETMDTFVDSSWYFLRYLDNQNDKELASEARQRDWMPIDLYFGGAEHTTMHLLYSRFWQKALFDLGLVTEKEPYKRRINRGLILGPDGNKMSKSKGNVIDPDEQVRTVGSDAVKMYLAFMGPYEGSNYPWDMGGIAGQKRFLERVNGLCEHIKETEPEEVTRLLHKTIKKVGKDIVQFKFNTAISSMMIFLNSAEKHSVTKRSYELFLCLLAPFAPHLTEDLWSESHQTSIHTEDWPKFDHELAKDEQVTIGVQFNGKVRGNITIAPDATEEEAIEEVKSNEQLNTRLSKIELKKIIYVPGRILNIVGKEE